MQLNNSLRRGYAQASWHVVIATGLLFLVPFSLQSATVRGHHGARAPGSKKESKQAGQ